MLKSVDLKHAEIDLAVAALLSMSCPLCPLHHERDCSVDPACRKLAERVAGGELAEVYGHGDG